jgi:hypothetical protein
MLRFVIRRKLLDRNSGLQSESLETLDVNCPELERVLRGGKVRQEDYDYREVAGVEILEACNQRIADQLKADAMTIFNSLEKPQIVRDVIEWYDAALRTTP